MSSDETENIPLGIFWMLCTMLLFVTMDAIAKLLGATYPVNLVVWGRFFFHMVLLAIFFRLSILTYLRSEKPALQVLRSTLMVITTALFFTGLSKSSLATATTMMFLSPIYVTVLSIPLLGESVGPRRWLGVFAGFAGAMIIIRPGSDSVSAANLYLLAAPLSNALYQLMTRKVREHDNEKTSLVYTALVGAIVTSVVAPFNWQTPDVSGWALLALAGALGCVSHLCLIRAFRIAPASAVAPFSYTSLIWATLYGYILFNNLPDRSTLLGASIIISSGIYIFYRENRLKKTPEHIPN